MLIANCFTPPQLAYLEPRPDAGWAPHLNPEVLLGVVAGDARTALRALRDWCGALELPFAQPDCKVGGGGAAARAAVRFGRRRCAQIGFHDELQQL